MRAMVRRGVIAGCILSMTMACGQPPAPDSVPKQEPSHPSAGASESAAPAPSAAPTPSASAAVPEGKAVDPPANDGPFSEPAYPRNPSDLGWLSHLVETLSKKPVTRDQVIAFLGQDGGADTASAGRRKVSPRTQYFENVVVYPMPHVKIDVALDVRFAKNGRPSRSTIGSVFGDLQAMPRAPDSQGSGPKLAHYEKGPHATVRVFVELDPADQTRVASVHVDVDGVKP